MGSDHEIISKVESALGAETATMFIEQGDNRHFIGAMTAAVAAYLLGKYADSFIKGLGIPEFAEKYGKKLRQAIEAFGSSFSGTEPPSEDQVKENTAIIVIVIKELHPHKDHKEALHLAEAAIELELSGKRIPNAEAKRITKKVISAIWSD